jgi:hypothetical protein
MNGTEWTELGQGATTNATAKRDFRAACGHKVRKGDRVYMTRERARSFKHARDAGTLYPWRKICSACANDLKRIEQCEVDR